MSEIKDKLQNERDALKEYTKLSRESNDYRKNISKTTNNIENLRTELDDMREIYHRTMILLRN
jgi:predicted  nucleic acid-binding Zn-ribbon protein